MKPLNKKERSKAFYKVVGLFVFALAIAIILGFVTMKSPELSAKKSDKTAENLEEQFKYQQETFAPSIQEINKKIEEALSKKEEGKNIDQELSDITAAITSIKSEIPEGDDWKKTMYDNLMTTYTNLRIAVDEQVAIKEELDDLQSSSSGSGEELTRLRGENKRLLADVRSSEQAASSGDPEAQKKLTEAQKELDKTKRELADCRLEVQIKDKELEKYIK